MTRKQIIQRAQFFFNAKLATTISGPDWTDAFDIAYESMSVEAECVSFSAAMNLTDSTRTYMVPTYALRLRPGGVITAEGELAGPVSADLLKQSDINYLMTEGTPNRWYVAETTVTSGTDTNWAVGLYPVPPATVANGLTLEGWRTPAALTIDTSVPPLPAHLHDCYAWGTCYFVAAREDEATIPPKRLAYFEQRYQAAVKRLRAGRTGFGSKLWVRGGAAPGHTPDEAQAAPFSTVTIT